MPNLRGEQPAVVVYRKSRIYTAFAKEAFRVMTQPETKPKYLKAVSFREDAGQAWEDSLNAVDEARRDGLV